MPLVKPAARSSLSLSRTSSSQSESTNGGMTAILSLSGVERPRSRMGAYISSNGSSRACLSCSAEYTSQRHFSGAAGCSPKSGGVSSRRL